MIQKLDEIVIAVSELSSGIYIFIFSIFILFLLFPKFIIVIQRKLNQAITARRQLIQRNITKTDIRARTALLQQRLELKLLMGTLQFANYVSNLEHFKTKKVDF